MPNLVTKCPSCNKLMKIASITCGECNIKLEGSFDLPPLLALPEEDIQFVMNFFKVQGAIKEMEKLYGVSYPTIKNRWAQIAKALKMEVAETQTATRMQILEALSRGEITADEAAKRLKEI